MQVHLHCLEFNILLRLTNKNEKNIPIKEKNSHNIDLPRKRSVIVCDDTRFYITSVTEQKRENMYTFFVEFVSLYFCYIFSLYQSRLYPQIRQSPSFIANSLSVLYTFLKQISQLPLKFRILLLHGDSTFQDYLVYRFRWSIFEFLIGLNFSSNLCLKEC